MSDISKSDTSYLTGIRGFAALIVVVGHSSNFGMHLFGFNLHGTAKAGVWLFFVLSAYLLTKKLWDDIATRGPHDAVRAYAIRRIGRIMPLYAIFLLLMMLLNLLTPVAAISLFTPTVALQNLSLVRGDIHLWTIPVEMSFYLALPVLLLLMRSRPTVVYVLVAAFCFYIIAGPTRLVANAISLPNYFVFFATGMTISLWNAPRLSDRAATLLMVAAFAVAIISSPRVLSYLFGGSPEEAIAYSLLFAGPWAAVIISTPYSKIFRALLSSRLLVWFGNISFSLYLIHYPLFEASRDIIPDFAGKGYLTAVIAIAISHVSYTRIEERLLRRLSRASALPPTSNLSPHHPTRAPPPPVL